MIKTHISKSIEIIASASKIYEILSDYRQWPKWSPWLIMDPNTKLEFSDDGSQYSWNSDRIGVGQMTTTDQRKDKWIKSDLIFTKPWKSKSKVRFDLVESGEGTKVTWSMDGSLPFFMFFMKKMMEGFVGMDYERGLLMLKEYVEEGKVSSSLEFKGTQSHPGFKYIGITRELEMDRMKDMAEDFEKLHEYITSNDIETDHRPFCIYHKFQVVKKKVKYTAGVPVKEDIQDLPDGMKMGKIASTEVNTVIHKGSYQYLGNVWSAQQNMMRSKEFKPKRGFHPWEEYQNMPGEVPDNELVTHVHFAVK